MLTPFTETQVNALHANGLINDATWRCALRKLSGELLSATDEYLGNHALRVCAGEISVLAERAVNAACKTIQDRLGVASGDLAAVTLSDGTIERALERYIRAELEAQTAATPNGDDAEAQ